MEIILVGNNSGTISDCRVESDVNSTEQVTAFSTIGSWSGGFVGRMEGGTIENCVVTKTHVMGNSNMQGGFVGLAASGTFRNCNVAGNVNHQFQISSLDYANDTVGGFVGGGHGASYYNCSANVNVQSKTSDCAFSDYFCHEVGGFAGRFTSGYISDCYARGEIKSASGNLYKPALFITVTAFPSFDKELITEFNIGLSTGNKLSGMLQNKYDISSLLQIDIAKEIGGNIYDTFQNRIIFPVIDENKNVIAFSGRKYLSDDLRDVTQPKYLNTKETIIFKKSNVLYNINNSLQEIKKQKEIIITEGFMDTIRMSSIGYKNVVALMGTAFTKDHLDKIISYKCRVVLNLDQDNAGKSATISIGDMLIKNNIDVSVIVFDDYKDSDEYIINKGKDAFDLAYKNRISFIDFKLRYLRSNKNMKDASEISKYINQAIESLNEIDDDILIVGKLKPLDSEKYTIRTWISNESSLPMGSSLHYHGLIEVEEKSE